MLVLVPSLRVSVVTGLGVHSEPDPLLVSIMTLADAPTLTVIVGIELVTLTALIVALAVVAVPAQTPNTTGVIKTTTAPKTTVAVTTSATTTATASSTDITATTTDQVAAIVTSGGFTWKTLLWIVLAIIIIGLGYWLSKKRKTV